MIEFEGALDAHFDRLADQHYDPVDFVECEAGSPCKKCDNCIKLMESDELVANIGRGVEDLMEELNELRECSLTTDDQKHSLGNAMQNLIGFQFLMSSMKGFFNGE